MMLRHQTLLASLWLLLLFSVYVGQRAAINPQAELQCEGKLDRYVENFDNHGLAMLSLSCAFEVVLLIPSSALDTPCRP